MNRPNASGDSPTRTLLQRLTGRSRPDAAAKALSSLLGTRQPQDVSSREVQELYQSQGLSEHEARALARDMWRTALSAFVDDDVITDDEATYLLELRRLFDISEDDAVALESELINPRYESVLRDVLADGQITGDERIRLEQLGKDLRIGKQIAEQIHVSEAQRAFQSILEAVLSDRLLTADEKTRVEKAARDLGVPIDKATQVRLDRSFVRWFLASGVDLPALDVEVSLQKGEICHFYCFLAWKEMRNDVLTTIDTGTIYLTNERIFFDGKSKNEAIEYDSVERITTYTDAVAFERGSGTAVYLAPSDAELVDLLSLALNRLLRPHEK
jgi:hypothetical protein